MIIRKQCITEINAPLYVGNALIDILEYLEERYRLDFDKLEREYIE